MGENCSAGSRILVSRDRKAELLEKVQAVLEGWKTGDLLDPDVKLGALIEEKHFQKEGAVSHRKGEGGRRASRVRRQRHVDRHRRLVRRADDLR